jgi:large subunit ribosomal protein L30e
MAKEKAVDANIEEIKKLLKEEKVIMGSKTVIKNLRKNQMKKIFVADNCKDETFSDIEQYCKINKTEFVKLNYPNDELGVICKKPFAISVIGVM